MMPDTITHAERLRNMTARMIERVLSNARPVASRLTRSRSAPARWREAFTRVLSPDYDPATFDAYARGLADGMSGPCDCRRHWKAWCAANPPDAGDVFGWLWRAKAAIDTRLNRTPLPHDAALAYWRGEVAKNG